LAIRETALRVGPKSAGSQPGPACYGRGGEAPTVTDANVVLGRLGAGLDRALGDQDRGGFFSTSSDHQELIARRVTVHIIDRLEVVEVREDGRQLRLETLGA